MNGRPARKAAAEHNLVLSSQETGLEAAMVDTARVGVKVLVFRLVSYGAGFIASVAIARALGPEGRGLYAFPVALLGLLTHVGHLGLQQGNMFLASRGIGLDVLWGNATIVALAVAGAIWSAFAILVLVGVTEVAGVPVEWFLVPVVQIPLLLQTVYWTNLLQLSGQVTATARAVLTGVLLHAFLATVLYLMEALTPFRVLLLAGVANASIWALLLATSRRAGLVGKRLDLNLMAESLRFGLKSYLGAILFLLLLRADELLVRHVIDFHALGLYSLAVTLAELLWLLTDPLAAALLRHQIHSEPGKERFLGYRVARLNFILAGTAGAVAWFAAPSLIVLVYGEAFAGTVPSFRLLIPGVVAIAVQRPLTAIIVKEGRPWLITLVAAVVFGLNVALNLLLLPRIGLIGASVSSTACYALLCAAYVMATYRREGPNWRDLLPRWSDVQLLLVAIRRQPEASR